MTSYRWLVVGSRGSDPTIPTHHAARAPHAQAPPPPEDVGEDPSESNVKYIKTLQAAALCALGCLAISASGPGVVAAATDGALPVTEDATLAPDWIVKQSDNICGLKNARQLSNPGKVDFPSLYDSTEEAKQIKRDGIDPTSPEGSRLRAAAYERIRKACQKVMTDQSLCSVWKSIRSRSGKTATDITETVRAEL